MTVEGSPTGRRPTLDLLVSPRDLDYAGTHLKSPTYLLRTNGVSTASTPGWHLCGTACLPTNSVGAFKRKFENHGDTMLPVAPGTKTNKLIGDIGSALHVY